MKGPALCFGKSITESRLFAASQPSRKHWYVRKIQNIYLHVHIKRLFLLYLVWSGSVWCRSSPKPDLRVLHCAIHIPAVAQGPRNETITQQNTKPDHLSPQQGTLFSQTEYPASLGWVSANNEALHLTICQIWQRNVATECILSRAAHTRHTIICS